MNYLTLYWLQWINPAVFIGYIKEQLADFWGIKIMVKDTKKGLLKGIF